MRGETVGVLREPFVFKRVGHREQQDFAPGARPSRAAPRHSLPLTAAPTASTAADTATVSAAATPSYTRARCGNSSGRVVLSFDDWAYGDPYRATRVGAYLKSRGVRGLFFLVNEQAKRYPDIVPTLRRQGHWVANHTYSHPTLTSLSNTGVRSQIRNGVASNLLRPPYGAYDSRVASLASDLGYRICMWTIDTRDWQRIGGSYRSTSSIR